MQNPTGSPDADTRRLVLRTVKEMTSALGERPAGVPVWQFPLRAFEIADKLAKSRTDPDATSMTAELCLELLAYTPLRMRNRTGAEVTTHLAQLATETGQTILELIAEFDAEHDSGDLDWLPAHDGGAHLWTTLPSQPR